MQASSEGAVVALSCPNCSAPFQAAPTEHLITCSYCGTSCRIASRTLFSMRRERAEAEPFWLLFRGPSARRRELEGKTRAAATEAREKAEEEAEERFCDPPARTGRSSLDRAAGFFLPLAIAAIVGAVGFKAEIERWISGQPRAEASAQKGSAQIASEPAAKPEAAPPGPPPRSSFQALQGCSCRANTDEERGRDLVQLAIRSSGNEIAVTSSGRQVTWRLEYYLDVSPGTSHYLEAEDGEGAPPAALRGNKARIGVACTNRVVAIAAAGLVSGWSTADGSRLWTARVDGWAEPHPIELTPARVRLTASGAASCASRRPAGAPPASA